MDDFDDLIRRLMAAGPGARGRLIEAAYPELRKLALMRFRDWGRSPDKVTKALAQASDLRFINSGHLESDDRHQFIALASRVMRTMIVDAVRERLGARRVGELPQLTLNTDGSAQTCADEHDILRVDEVLHSLSLEEPTSAKVAEMRFFGGYSEEEIAAALAIDARSVRRHWCKARLLLGQTLKR